MRGILGAMDLQSAIPGGSRVIAGGLSLRLAAFFFSENTQMKMRSAARGRTKAPHARIPSAISRFSCASYRYDHLFFIFFQKCALRPGREA